MFRQLMIMVLALAATGAAAAQVRDIPVDRNADAFAQQRQTILARLDDGHSYPGISADDKDKVKTALARMSATIRRAGGAEHLNKRQRVAVFNDQELINNILTDAGKDNQMICKRETGTGTHVETVQCKTVAQRREETEYAQDMLRRMPTAGGNTK